jgi:hypothetical protein
MPIVCTNSSAVLTGNLAQWGNQNYFGGNSNGLAPDQRRGSEDDQRLQYQHGKLSL